MHPCLQIRDALSEHAVRVIDLFREWDDDGSGSISKRELCKALGAMGLAVPREELEAVFTLTNARDLVDN